MSFYKDEFDEPYIYHRGRFRPLSYFTSLLKFIFIGFIVATICFDHDSNNTWKEKIDNMDNVYVSIDNQSIKITQTEEMKVIFSKAKSIGLNIDYKYNENYFIILADEDSGKDIVFYPALGNNNIFIKNNTCYKVSKKSGESFEDIINQYLVKSH